MVLYSRARAPDWSAQDIPAKAARCRSLPTPVPGEDPFFEDEDYALKVCNGGNRTFPFPCPMRHECLVFSLLNHEGAGVWGGMLYHDRMNMKRNPALSRSDWKWHPPTPKSAKEPSGGEPSESQAA
ncbi:WhiB family transcriptional regulator [Streptomyces sp. NPDC017448]|uniref:WhiB family transcriptional regulator n=1 Tax=Streptomyces sp. NPDC017448 TaxID=3364996 RepID=UPI0037BD8D29